MSALVPSEEVLEGEAEDEGPFYVSQKALLLAKLKLKSGKAVDRSLVETLAYPGELPDEEVVVPLDTSGLGGVLTEAGTRLDVDAAMEKWGAEGTIKALQEAQLKFLQNAAGEPATTRAAPMTAAEWREAVAAFFEEGEEEEAFDEGGEEEEEADLEEEVEEEEDEAAQDAEPPAKRARSG
mmetsp:Transcript_52521/g.154852  ORF Transcript_52521/g.154852 Transcript_52521/m.154852 type:complete len:181 (-) Transcript_52521:37-579(-)